MNFHQLDQTNLEFYKNLFTRYKGDYCTGFGVVSPSHLRQIFKKKTGDTLSNYLWMLRREKAKEYLLATNLSIKEVVENVGYIDVSSFIRKFKTSTGLSPGEFRKIGGQ